MQLIRKSIIALTALVLVLLIANCAQMATDVELKRELEDAAAIRSIPVVVEETDAVSSEPVIITGSRIRDRRIQAAPLSMRYSAGDYSRQELKSKNTKSTVQSWKPSSQAANNAIIKVGDSEDIHPEALDIKVQIDGFRARVLIDGFYRNSHDSNLEGAFKFRMPNGATPYFFAFGKSIKFTAEELKHPFTLTENEQRLSLLTPDAVMQSRVEQWSEPKEARMVPKEQAAFAYHDTVSQRIDPALVEWAGAGVFTAKVFPLFAKKLHRVVIGYDLDLNRIDDKLILDLPITDAAIQKRIHLDINQPENTPVKIHRVVENDLRTPIAITTTQGHASESISGTLINGVRTVINLKQEPWLLGKKQDQLYFAKRWTNKLKAETTRSNKNAVFAIDTSLSASPDKFYLWVELLHEILVQNQDYLENFAVMKFDVSSQWWQKKFVKNSSSNRRKLKQYLESLVLEGATDLEQSLGKASKPKWLKSETNSQGYNYDLFLMTDGAATWGEKEPFVLSDILKSGYVDKTFTYRLSASGENTELLNHLSRELGGASYYLAGGKEVSRIAVAHNKMPWEIKSVAVSNGEDVLISGRPNVLVPGQTITFVGRLNGESEGELVVSLERSGETKLVRLPIEEKIDSDLAARAYGQVAVGQLESLGDLERKVATAYANHFRIPGKSSSLLMLESEEDYKRYNIKSRADSFVVDKVKVSSVFRELSDSFAKRIANPKLRFLSQINKIQKLEFLKFQMPDAVSVLMNTLPESAFHLNIKQLPVKKQTSTGIAKSYLKKLAQEKNNYSIITEEAERRRKKFGASDALKVMSSLVELAPSDTAILRDVAFAAENWELPTQAYKIHKAVLILRPYEPHSYNYLAKLASQLGNNDLALLYFEMGLASSWQDRFGDYKLIHQIDYVNFLNNAVRKNEGFLSLDYAQVKLEQLKSDIKLDGSDLIVAISWNTDRTDVDLHVVEPSGEECYFSHNHTVSGGYITRDVTDGFGPEMYVNSSAPKGNYDLYVNYFSSDRNQLGLKTKVLIRTIRNWGTPSQSEDVQTIVLSDNKEKHRLKRISI